MARKLTTISEAISAVGIDLGATEWLLITQDRVDIFAQATGDAYFIHTDPAKAAETAFKGTIAHGFLTLSLTASMYDQLPIKIELNPSYSVNYGLNKVRFISPVQVGKRVRLRSTIQSVELVSDRVCQIALLHTMEIEGQDRPAMIAEYLSRQFFDTPISQHARNEP